MGAPHVAGLTDLGGFAIRGSVRLTGEPFRHMRVSLAPSARLLSPANSAAKFPSSQIRNTYINSLAAYDENENG